MKKERTYNLNLFFLIFPLMIIIGKVIRWTILKSVLVDMSIGNGMIIRIINGAGWFTSFTDTGVSDAAGNASVFFSLINFFDLSTTVGFEIYISILWNLILLFLILRCKKELNLLQFLFLAISIAVLNIWDFCLAKEPLQMLFFVLIALVINNDKFGTFKKYFFIILILFVSVIYYRVYYILVIAFLLIVSFVFNNYFLKKNKISIYSIIITFVLFALIYFVMLNFIKFFSYDSYAELIRVRTRIGQAHTEMTNLFPSTNLFVFSVDYYIMILRMLFPIELIPMGIKYLPYVFYQLLITFFLFKNIKVVKHENKSERLALYLYLAFLLSSATFEPDFGSWVRHEAAVFPVLMIVTDIIPIFDLKKEKKNEKEFNKID